MKTASIFAMNCGDGEFTAHFDAQAGCGIDLITGDSVEFWMGDLRSKEKQQ